MLYTKKKIVSRSTYTNMYVGTFAEIIKSVFLLTVFKFRASARPTNRFVLIRPTCARKNPNVVPAENA